MENKKENIVMPAWGSAEYHREKIIEAVKEETDSRKLWQIHKTIVNIRQ